MTKQEYEALKEMAKTYRYNSFEYLEYEQVMDFKLIQNDEALLLIYGRNRENEITAAYWAANDAVLLAGKVKGLGHNILVNFIPAEWKDYFAKQGFSDYAIYRSYWVKDLDLVDGRTDYSFLKEEEYGQASAVTRAVKNQSRGFHGESEEWIGSWIRGEDPNAREDDTKDCNIIVHREGKTVAGIACVGIYGHDSEKGPVLWLREIAVLPGEQGKGIGKKLILQSFRYGKERGAKRAFLMADDCNTNAIGLYKKTGFVPNEDLEINLTSN